MLPRVLVNMLVNAERTLTKARIILFCLVTRSVAEFEMVARRELRQCGFISRHERVVHRVLHACAAAYSCGLFVSSTGRIIPRRMGDDGAL